MWWVLWILVALTVFPLACPVLASFSTSFSTYAFPFQILCLNGTRFLLNWHKFLWLIAATYMSWSFGGTKKLRKIFKPCALTGVFVGWGAALQCSSADQHSPRFLDSGDATKKHQLWILIRSSGERNGRENYCWWTRSCTTKGDDYPIIYSVLTIRWCRICPSTVPLKVHVFFPCMEPLRHVWIKRIFGCSKKPLQKVVDFPLPTGVKLERSAGGKTSTQKAAELLSQVFVFFWGVKLWNQDAVAENFFSWNKQPECIWCM